MTIQELEQELFEMERKLESMFNSCSQDLAVGIEKLRGELAELKESKKEGKWKPKNGETFWFRNVRGESESYTHEDFFNSDKWLINNLPIFPTKEACARYWHFMDTVKEKSYGFSKEELVDTNIEKWYIGLKHGGLCVDFVYGVGLLGATYFKTEEDAQYIIDNFKEELMEYFV